MKTILLILLSIFIISCSLAEERIKDYSYTNDWYYLSSSRFQVYKTKKGKKYILVLNKKEKIFKRRYMN